MDNTGVVENPKPTWETQRQARTFQLGIPAPRGQITDRNGQPLAQTRLSYNLAVSSPRRSIGWTARSSLSPSSRSRSRAACSSGRSRSPTTSSSTTTRTAASCPSTSWRISCRRSWPSCKGGLTPNLILRQTYVRFYPNGELAGHIIGFTGREAPLSLRPIENNDLIFTESQGREGLEQVFDGQLRGQPGELDVTFDRDGNKTSERIGKQPVPGYNIVTTLDENLQRICEKVLRENCKRGAIVVLDPNTGEVLALASFPGFNPNDFVPIVKKQAYDAYNNDPAVPAPPPSLQLGLSARLHLQDIRRAVRLRERLDHAENKIQLPERAGGREFVFRNWKKSDAGQLNFVEALTQSCNTWFYQAGLKTGSKPIIEWTNRLGLGRRTGITLGSEDKGNIPNDEYMLRVHHRKILQGDVANMSIGQGDILITPLQMAQAMGAIASGGHFHQTRLVKQVQALDNRVVAAYPDRVRDELDLKPQTLENLRKALIAVTEDGNGTGHHAQVKGFKVAGKTGTAQWGPKEKQRTAAWFTGFVPAENPQYAFCALYEGEPGDNTIHGGSHAAPLIGKVLAEIYHPSKKKGDSNDDSSDKDKDKDKGDAKPGDDQSN